MNLTVLGWAVEQSLKLPVATELLKICDRWYSPYYNYFYLLALGNGGVAVELGVDQGRGSAAFTIGGCRTFGVDHTRKVGLDNLIEYTNFTFIQSDSMPVPSQLQQARIDFLHIDTEHSYSMAKAEFEAYQPYLNSPAAVFFDDLHAQENAVLQYFMELPYPKIQDDRLHPVNGFGVVLYNE